jgi:hypothetical protein
VFEQEGIVSLGWSIRKQGGFLLTHEQLGLIAIKRVIFHDVPRHLKGQDGSLVLAFAETEIDTARRNMLRTKLIRVLDAKVTYPILFDQTTGSPIPATVRDFTKKEQNDSSFVDGSQTFAKHLQQVQWGAVSGGLLCVIDFAADGNRGLVLMKLDREGGAQLKLDKAGNKTRFAMSVLEDLVLTDGTRLFKTAAFLRVGDGDDDFEMAACDSQHRVTDSDDMARFWLRYLGCKLLEDPRVATSKFYNTTIEFINTVIAEPIMRTQLYDSLHAELRSNKAQVVPKTFIQEYIPEELKTPYHAFLEDHHVSLVPFPKDNVDIKGKLRRSTYLSEQGVVVSAPADRENLVEITDAAIVVQDKLKRVGRN